MNMAFSPKNLVNQGNTMASDLNQIALEAAQQLLDAHPDFKVLRRLPVRTQFAEPDGRPLLRGVVVDTETTGVNHGKDVILELGMVLFEYDPATGQAYRILGTFDELEAPSFPIPPDSIAIHGITDEMVAGKRIDDARVAEFLDGVSIVIAHNSEFDRQFLERRLPVFEALPWGCSLKQIGWKNEGVGSAKLDYIAYQFGLFFDPHRAEEDCRALLEILQQTLPSSGELALKTLLDQSSQKSYKVCATGSPFDSRDKLKGRGYRWDAEKKVWHTTVTGDDAIKDEVAWLKSEIYSSKSPTLKFEVLDATTLFSSRPGKQVSKAI